jgi:nucleoside phosphorylase
MDQLRWIARQFVVLYDVADRRAWLVDGASALLHLVRTSLTNNWNDGFKDDFIFKWEMIKEASPSATGQSAAISVLKDSANKGLQLYSSSNYRFIDRVEHIRHTLEQVLTHQAQVNLERASGLRLTHTPQTCLEGYDFMDIAMEEDHFGAHMTQVQVAGTGWTNITRAIHAVTLFGNGFGELITPSNIVSVCPSWAEVPKDQEYLTVCVPILQEILKKKGNTGCHPWRVAEDLFWYTPDITFETCHCAQAPAGTSCNRAQFLLHKQQFRSKEKSISSPTGLEANGAVIFGFTSEFLLRPENSTESFDERGSSSPVAGSDIRLIDSALGESIDSSSPNHWIRHHQVKRWREPDLSASSLMPPVKRRRSNHHSSSETSFQMPSAMRRQESREGNRDNESHGSSDEAVGLQRKNKGKARPVSFQKSWLPGHETYLVESWARTNRPLSEEDYMVGWICAIKTELNAARRMLDENHGEGLGHGSDNNFYILGRIGDHNVVLTCLPMGRYGNNTAAMVATRMMNKFPNITMGLMVGIGGGLPYNTDDIRLGDVVVSKPDLHHGGVLQYDMGKFTVNGFKCTGFLSPPPERLLAVLQQMPAHGSTLQSCSALPYPGEEFDRLFKPDYQHVSGKECTACDEHELIKRSPGNRGSGPRIFYGTIASGNAVIKDPTTRDKLTKDHTALCFEMEAAGLLNSNFPCLVIRGISDYADSHKNDIWQDYAAATAAQFGKDFLLAARFLNGKD